MKRFVVITVLLLVAFMSPIFAESMTISQTEVLDQEFRMIQSEVARITKVNQMLEINGNVQVPAIALFMGSIFSSKEMDCFFERQPIPEEITKLQKKCSNFLHKKLLSELENIAEAGELKTVSGIEDYLELMCNYAPLGIRKLYLRQSFPLLPFLRIARTLLSFELSVPLTKEAKRKALSKALKAVEKMEKNITKAVEKDLKTLRSNHKGNDIWKDFFHMKH